MSIVISQRVVVSGLLGRAVCFYPIRQNSTQTVRIDYMSCSCTHRVNMCIAQGADKSFALRDAPTTDYSNATEVTFDVWERVNDPAPAVLSKSLTGGDISLSNNYTLMFDVSSAESLALTATSKYYEVWVTLPGGERRPVGKGRFTVEDTRKFD